MQETMNSGLLYAIFASTITMIGCMISLFLWLRSEANSDRRDFAGALRIMHDEFLKEMKDFHGRLCAIEEKNKGK